MPHSPRHIGIGVSCTASANQIDLLFSGLLFLRQASGLWPLASIHSQLMTLLIKFLNTMARTKITSNALYLHSEFPFRIRLAADVEAFLESAEQC